MPLMAPSTYIALAVEQAQGSAQPFSPDELDYAEKPGGFQCGTCRHHVPRETAATCTLLQRPIDLTMGCCVAWAYDTQTLQEEEALA